MTFLDTSSYTFASIAIQQEQPVIETQTGSKTSPRAEQQRLSHYLGSLKKQIQEKISFLLAAGHSIDSIKRIVDESTNKIASVAEKAFLHNSIFADKCAQQTNQLAAFDDALAHKSRNLDFSAFALPQKGPAVQTMMTEGALLTQRSNKREKAAANQSAPANTKEKADPEKIYRFPSQKLLTTCLSQHPVAGTEANPYLTEKKIIQTVAKEFAASEANSGGIEMGVMLTLDDLNTVQLHVTTLLTIHMTLVDAVKECALNKD
jgi:hypothetical protein